MNYIGSIFLFILLFDIISCVPAKETEIVTRIFYVNSYHHGYGSSDDVMKGIEETFTDNKIDLRTFYLDAKQKSSEQEILNSVNLALKEIEKFSPDLLMVSDDNAVKELVVPYFNDRNLPVVFCGVNWSAEQYHLGKNITGMIEVLPLKELLSEIISSYPSTKKLVVLSENSLSEQNNKTILDTLYRALGLDIKYSLADDFETWKSMFLEANQSADLIYMPTNGAIRNWNNEEAMKIVAENIKIPSVTCDDFMMPYAVLGLTKVAKEQGIWAAETVLKILNGKKPSEIPISKNKQTKAMLNLQLAKKIDFKISENLKNKIVEFQN